MFQVAGDCIRLPTLDHTSKPCGTIASRIRGLSRGEALFDTTRALYVWEWPNYPQYYIPRADVRMELLGPHGEPAPTPQGDAQRLVLRSGDGKAWMCSFPASQVLPITGLVAFLNEKVDIVVDGLSQPWPRTHMSN